MRLTVRGIDSRSARSMAHASSRCATMRDDARLAQDHDVVFGQEVQGGRASRPGEQHHASGLGDSGEGAGHAEAVRTPGGAPLDHQPVRPPHPFELRRRHDLVTDPVLLDVPHHDLGDPRKGGDRRDPGMHRVRLAGEEADRIAVERRLRVRHGCGKPAVESGPHALRQRPRSAQRTPDGPEDALLRGVHPPPPARRFDQADMNVAPSGAGRSRLPVQPPASGSRRKRPR